MRLLLFTHRRILNLLPLLIDVEACVRPRMPLLIRCQVSRLIRPKLKMWRARLSLLINFLLGLLVSVCLLGGWRAQLVVGGDKVAFLREWQVGLADVGDALLAVFAGDDVLVVFEVGLVVGGARRRLAVEDLRTHIQIEVLFAVFVLTVARFPHVLTHLPLF
jgi:hypothetical protein